jgi:hypothetical protein
MHLELHIPTDAVGHSGFDRAKDDLTLHLDHILVPELLCAIQALPLRPIWPEGELQEPAPIAKIDEEEPTEITAAVDPSGQDL